MSKLPKSKKRPSPEPFPVANADTSGFLVRAMLRARLNRIKREWKERATIGGARAWDDTPENRAPGYLKRSIYKLALEIRSAGWDLEALVPKAAFPRNPRTRTAFRAMIDYVTGSDFPRNERSRYVIELQHAFECAVPYAYVVGFIYQCGGAKMIAARIKTQTLTEQ